MNQIVKSIRITWCDETESKFKYSRFMVLHDICGLNEFFVWFRCDTAIFSTPSEIFCYFKMFRNWIRHSETVLCIDFKWLCSCIYLKLVSKLQLHCVIVWFSLVPLNCSHILCALTVNPIAKHSHTQNNTDDSLMNSHSLLNLFNKFILMESSTYKKKQCARAHTWIYLNEEKEKKNEHQVHIPGMTSDAKKQSSHQPPTHAAHTRSRYAYVFGPWCVVVYLLSSASIVSFVVFVYTHPAHPNDLALNFHRI